MGDVVSLHQLAKHFRLPTRWLKAQARAGRLPHLKAGRRLLFNPAAVGKALAELAAAQPGEVASAAS